MTVGAKVGGALRARGLRRGPTEDETAILEEEDEGEAQSEEGSGDSSKRVAFATLPDKYEPLGAEARAQSAQPAESKSRKRRRKLRKYGKVRRASRVAGRGGWGRRASWRLGTRPERSQSSRRSAEPPAAVLLL